MSVKVRPFKKKPGVWEVDIRLRLPNGQPYRERVKAPNASKSAAKKWGEDRERHLLQNGLPQPKKEVPTVEKFAPRFIEDHAKANQQKPSGIAAKQSILRVHLIPQLGSLRLDEITTQHVQSLKGKLSGFHPKTVNNALTVLSTMLKRAVEWNVIDAIPCSIKLLKAPKPQMGFYSFEEYDRLVAAAASSNWRSHLVVLLGGEAGLRCGEMMALQWNDVDFALGQISVTRSDWEGQITSPKGGRTRTVSMTSRLSAALKGYRHLRGPLILCQDDGQPLTRQMVQTKAAQSARACGLKEGVHILRHTFCSHLAMQGAPPRAIQELAGHRSYATTQRYLHLSPSALHSAVKLLENRGATAIGEVGETALG